jgi:hypothetical protein
MAFLKRDQAAALRQGERAEWPNYMARWISSVFVKVIFGHWSKRT